MTTPKKKIQKDITLLLFFQKTTKKGQYWFIIFIHGLPRNSVQFESKMSPNMKIHIKSKIREL